MLQKLKNIIVSHKIISIIILIIILTFIYFIFKGSSTTEIRYVTSVIEKGNIVSSVSATGQIEAQNTLDLKPKVSGDITYVGVKVGSYVNRGDIIASIDSRDAKIALENAQISLAKLTKNPDSLTLIQKQNNLDKAYDDGWNNVASSINELNLVIDNLGDLYSSGYLSFNNIMMTSNSVKDKVNIGEKSYYNAKDSLLKTENLYKSLSRTSEKKDIDNLVTEMYNTTKIIADSIKITQSAFDSAVNSLDQSGTTKVNTTQSDITSWTKTSNDSVSSISSSLSNIKESTQSLSDLVSGSDPLDIRSALLNVEAKQNAYNDYFVKAPFSGVIASLTAVVGQSSGSSVGTLITKEKTAKVSLNEVDIAKIKLDQKVTLTFDAIDDLTISGKVSEIDGVGTVSQGVVSYNVLISLDVNDDRVKPGMSINANIITDKAFDVISVPSSAIKTKNGTSYVEVFSSPLVEPSTGIQGSISSIPPTQVKVETGLSNDTDTEIISGLNIGDIIVTKTITSTVSKSSNTPSILNAVGGNNKGGASAGALRAVAGH